MEVQQSCTKLALWFTIPRVCNLLTTILILPFCVVNFQTSLIMLLHVPCTYTGGCNGPSLGMCRVHALEVAMALHSVCAVYMHWMLQWPFTRYVPCTCTGGCNGPSLGMVFSSYSMILFLLSKESENSPHRKISF
jgi:hypothetical protein